MVRVGGHAYGVPLDSVVEVTRMVALAPLPVEGIARALLTRAAVPGGAGSPG